MTDGIRWDGRLPPSIILMGQPIPRMQLLEQEAALWKQRVEELSQKPTGFAVVLDIQPKHLLVASGGGEIVEIARPSGLELHRGMVVSVNPNGQVRARVDIPPFGQIMTVKEVVGEDIAVVEVGGGITRTVNFRGDKPKPGDRVILGLANIAIEKNLGQGDRARLFQEDTGVDWDDIGGQAEAKRQMIEAIEEPFTKSEVYKRFGLRRVKGALLHGPPGCGKTMFMKAASTALARIHGKSAKATGHIHVKGPDLLNKFVGATEENIRGIFSQARIHFELEGYPALISIDEADAVLGKRGETRWEGMERTMVPMFLAEMDGLTESCAIVILATNRPESLDPAVVRDGRIDRRIEVKRPTRAEAFEILFRIMKERPCDDAEDLSEIAVDEVFAPKQQLYWLRAKDGKHQRFTLGDVVSGAMVVGLAERATQRAVRRALAGDASEGIVEADVRSAVADVLEEQRNINHVNELRLVVESTGSNFERLDQVKP